MTQNSIANTGSIIDVDNIRIDSDIISATNTDGNLILAPDGSGVVSITDAVLEPNGDRAEHLGSSTNSWDNVYADGISFNDGTDVMSAYVGETSWTPVVEGSSAAGAGTYSLQQGSSIRIGDYVYITFNIDWSAHTGTGGFRITGFPVAMNASSLVTGTIQCYNGWTFPANTLWLVPLSAGTASTTKFLIQGTDSSGNTIAPLLESNQAVGIRGSLTYYA